MQLGGSLIDAPSATCRPPARGARATAKCRAFVFKDQSVLYPTPQQMRTEFLDYSMFFGLPSPAGSRLSFAGCVASWISLSLRIDTCV